MPKIIPFSTSLHTGFFLNDPTLNLKNFLLGQARTLIFLHSYSQMLGNFSDTGLDVIRLLCVELSIIKKSDQKFDQFRFLRSRNSMNIEAIGMKIMPVDRELFTL